jgi:hypothetical protein
VWIPKQEPVNVNQTLANATDTGNDGLIGKALGLIYLWIKSSAVKEIAIKENAAEIVAGYRDGNELDPRINAIIKELS